MAEPSSPIPEPGLELVTRLLVDVEPPVEAGTTAHGVRRIIPIRGGTATGPGFEGTIERGGSDVQLIRPDGVAEVAARYIITTPKGTHVFNENTGVRHAPPEAMARLVRGEPVARRRSTSGRCLRDR
jgi:hypothetical protein